MFTQPRSTSFPALRRGLQLAAAGALCALALLGMRPAPSPAGAEAIHDNLTPLYSWWSAERKDNYATTTWPGEPGQVRAEGGYQFVRVEGLVYRADKPQPRNTVKLFQWWSPTRQDNFITSDTRWDPAVVGTTFNGYTFIRIEGFIHNDARFGTLPLTNWWAANAEGPIEDNFATANPEFAPAVRTRWNDYAQFRIEGYINAFSDPTAPDTPEAFGYDSLATDDGAHARGTRPLVVVIGGWSDRPASRTPAEMTSFLYGGFPNIPDYFSDNSSGAFTYANGGVVGTYVPLDDPRSAGADESTRNCALDVRDAGGIQLCPGTLSNYAMWRDNYIRFAEARLNFASFDANGDRRITNSEVNIIFATGDVGSGGQTRGECYNFQLDGMSVSCLYSSFLTSDGAFYLFAHEATHQLGMFDLYGSQCLSTKLSLATCGGNYPYSTEVYHLDAWHKIKLGWTKPRVVSIRSPRISLELEAATFKYDPRPVIVYDPIVGRNEFFILERRIQDEYDRDMVDARGGIAIWHVRTDAAGRPLLTDGICGCGLQDATVWALSAPDGRIATGYSSLWQREHSAIALPWSGTADPGFTIDVGDTNSIGASDTIEVTLGRGMTPAARLDGIALMAYTRDTLVDQLRIQGNFPLDQASSVVALEGAGINLDVVEWNADSIVVRIPGNAPAGTHEIVVYNDSSRTRASNGVRVTIADMNLDPDRDGLSNSRENDRGTDPFDWDSDDDSCSDGAELDLPREAGGARDPLYSWDFYDVTGDNLVSLDDALAILALYGEAHAPENANFDRSSDPDRPWQSREATDGIDLTDALANLAQFGDECEPVV